MKSSAIVSGYTPNPSRRIRITLDINEQEAEDILALTCAISGSPHDGKSTREVFDRLHEALRKSKVNENHSRLQYDGTILFKDFS